MVPAVVERGVQVAEVVLVEPEEMGHAGVEFGEKIRFLVLGDGADTRCAETDTGGGGGPR